MFSGNDDVTIGFARNVVSGNDEVTIVLARYGFWVMMTFKVVSRITRPSQLSPRTL